MLNILRRWSFASVAFATFCVPCSSTETAAPALPRELGGVELGITPSIAMAKFHAFDSSKAFQSSLAPGDVVYAFKAPALPAGASGMIGHFANGKLWRLEATYQTPFTSVTTWENFVAQHQNQIKTVPKREETRAPKQTVVTWNDASTSLSVTRDLAQGTVSGYYYAAVQDDAVWRQLYGTPPTPTTKKIAKSAK